MVSIRLVATPRARASSTYPSPRVSMKASTPLGAVALIPVRDAVTIRDRDHAVAFQPLVVVLARQADDRGPGYGAKAGRRASRLPGGSGDDNGLALLGLDGMYCSPRGHAGDVQAAGPLPRDLLWLAREVIGLDQDQLGLGGPLVSEPDRLVTGGESGDLGAGLLEDPGEVAALPAAFTRTRTCPSPGSGRTTSSTRNTSIAPNSPNSPHLTAFGMTSAPPFGWN
jgi:hypothetical protein